VGAGDLQVYCFSARRLTSSISCSVSRGEVGKGGSITVSGSVSPPVLGRTVTLTYGNMFDGSTFTRTVRTGSDGSYRDSFTPGTEGAWTVTASWDGDAMYEGASSSTDFTVKEAESLVETPLGPSIDPLLLVGILVSVLLAVGVVFALRRRKRPGLPPPMPPPTTITPPI